MGVGECGFDCVYVYMCVCVKESERGESVREREGESKSRLRSMVMTRGRGRGHAVEGEDLRGIIEGACGGLRGLVIEFLGEGEEYARLRARACEGIRARASWRGYVGVRACGREWGYAVEGEDMRPGARACGG